eukprot:scaffold86_cov338-Pavlova_lutheri.AAC.66
MPHATSLLTGSVSCPFAPPYSTWLSRSDTTMRRGTQMRKSRFLGDEIPHLLLRGSSRATGSMPAPLPCVPCANAKDEIDPQNKYSTRESCNGERLKDRVMTLVHQLLEKPNRPNFRFGLCFSLRDSGDRLKVGFTPSKPDFSILYRTDGHKCVRGHLKGVTGERKQKWPSSSQGAWPSMD